MPRSIPTQRFQQLVDVATRIFIAQGYRRTQMADVAAAMSLAKGTLYGYVESKAALFQLAITHCDDVKPLELPTDLPIPTPAPGATLAMFQERLAREGVMPKLTAALEREAPPADPRGVARELDGIFSELFGTLHANHRGIRLMEACSLDHPELADHWHNEGRYGYLELLARYLERRAEAGALVLATQSAVVARFILETITTWAVHIHFDPSPQALPLESRECVVLHFLRAGLLGGEAR